MKMIFFAGALEDYPIPGFSKLSPALKEGVILFGALFFVSAVILAWVYFSGRQRRRAARRAERNRRRPGMVQDAAKGVAEIHNFVKERQGRRRREHRPRNPTLAETGGLPPIRTETPPSSPTRS